MKQFTIKFIATAAGFGLPPVIPGTTGTIPGVIIAWLVFPYGWVVQVTSTLAALIIGVWSATRAEEYYGHDGKPIVIDEVAGIMIAYLFVPVTVTLYLVGFVVFRVLDIWKPYPARKWENLPAGWGIMGDDFAVGIYTNIFLQMLVLFRIGI